MSGLRTPNTKFHENPFAGILVVPYGKTEGRTDMTRLTAFRKFLKNEPKKKERKGK
jgi:hypothetical protein